MNKYWFRLCHKFVGHLFIVWCKMEDEKIYFDLNEAPFLIAKHNLSKVCKIENFQNKQIVAKYDYQNIHWS